jgi:hypothetical protein
MKIACTVLFLALAACAPQNARIYEPIAQHTLKAGPEADSDVVWVQRYDSAATQTRLLRCTSTQQGPRCDEAKLPQ